MTLRRIAPVLALVLFVSAARADDWPQFRGPERNGISKEKGLLQTWPKDGPRLLWTYKNAGLGFAGPAIVGETMYTMGGFDGDDYVFALDLKTQQERWRTKVGPLFSYGAWGDGPRSTPTVDGDRVYALGGHGDLVCTDLKGQQIWRKNLEEDFAGEMMTEWGHSESVLIDGDQLICTPGGKKGTLAALNKKTGDLIWQSNGLTHKAPYSSAMVHVVDGVRTYVQTSYIDEDEGGFISGFSAKAGNVLWSQSIFKHHSYAIAPNPIIKDNLVYVTSGYGGGCHLFEIAGKDGAFKARELYKPKQQKAVKNTHGGVVLIGDHIYGHSETQTWVCQELKTGNVKWTERDRLSSRSGAITAAGGRLYLYSEDGEVALLVPNPEKWDEVGTFTLPETSKLRATLPNFRAAAIWTHPVIANGRLYLRDQELIFCYKAN